MSERTDLAEWRAWRSGVAAVDELVGTFAVERLSESTFTGHSTSVPENRVFGGQMLAQSVVAATMTVAPPSVAHSLHAYFVRAGRQDVPFRFAVTTLRDGRSFAVRRVDALQDNEVVTSMTASFHLPEDGLTHQDAMPDRPAPDDLPARTPFLISSDGPARAGAVDLRACPQEPGAAESSVWLRVAAPLPDDPLLHQAMLVYLSDFSILHGAFNRHRVAREQVRTASLDHSIWLQRPGRADDWLLHDSRSPAAAGARAVGRANLFTVKGELVATAAQEMLVRRIPGA
ncbi:acyl-CoA thioesterase [Actinophytocola oryzae]|uniref:Acyl-CoA thioesterase-2 n=1 Tax=Actinophytocola oryzae TaxID=502181 RepID=A0A4R7W750_9PSEU|nr:acyl-CoA thioesterase domain-containing protein [Actinophytocola oryzae]TDV57547.1 acyl-CoA thioesterase-2 [Actinophytocola oryzae]